MPGATALDADKPAMVREAMATAMAHQRELAAALREKTSRVAA